MTPTETLRAAAVRLREVAGAATPGPWRDSGVQGNRYSALVSDTMPTGRPTRGGWDDTEGYGGYLVGESIVAPDRAYIALMHPLVGLALAEWLDVVARDWALAEDQADPLLPDADGWMTAIEDTLDSHALAVARLILGEVA